MKWISLCGLEVGEVLCSWVPMATALMQKEE